MAFLSGFLARPSPSAGPSGGGAASPASDAGWLLRHFPGASLGGDHGISPSSILTSPVVLVLLVPVVFLLTWTARDWARLRHVPGPRWAGVSKWWMLKHTVGGQMHVALKEVCDQYGPLVRIGPNDLVTDDPELLRKLWGVRSPYRKGSFYEAIRFDPRRDNLVSMRDERRHAELRSKMAAGYSGKENEHLESSIDAQILSLVRLISRSYLSGSDADSPTSYRPMDLAKKMQYLTLDVITSLALGGPFGYLSKDEDVHSYIAMTEDNMPVMLVLGCLPTLAVILQSPFFRWLMPSETDRLGFGKFIGVAKQVVGQRVAETTTTGGEKSGGKHPVTKKATKKERRDMLASFLAHGLTREEAEGEALVQVIAGSDSVATVLRMTLLYLATSPRVYGRLAEEIERGIADGTIPPAKTSSSSARGGADDEEDAAADEDDESDGYDVLAAQYGAVVSDAAARRLPYLQAVIREGLRIFPPVVGLMGVEVPHKPRDGSAGPDGEVIVAGTGANERSYFVPGGTEIGVSVAGVMRSRDVFGADADLFRPERWLEAEREARDEGGETGPAAARLRRMQASWDLAFKYGKWQCLGKAVALMELNKVFVELLKRFDFELIDPTQPFKSYGAGIFIQSDLWVKITRSERANLLPAA